MLIASTGARLAAALYQGDAVAPLPGIHDQLSYDALAQRVTRGHGFTFAADWWPATRAGEPTAHWSFAYTLYLAGVYTLLGHHPLAARLIQALVAGLLQPWLAWRIARRLFGPRVGVVAAALSAGYAYFIYYAGALMTETFYILAVLWGLDVATAMACRPSAMDPAPVLTAGRRPALWGQRHRGNRMWGHLGLAFGVAALLRQVILGVVPVLMMVLWTARSSRQALIHGTLVACAVIAALILPWTIRNQVAFGRLVPLNTNVGYAFYWANHPIHGTRFVPILPAHGPSYQDLIPRELRALDEAALDRALLWRGFQFVREDPGRYLRLSLGRAAEYFKFWPSSASSTAANLARVLSFGLAVPFIILGLCVAPVVTPPNQRTHTAAALCLLYAFIATYSSVHLLSWALIRYRLPVDAVLLLFAAVGVTWIFDRCPPRAGRTATDQARCQ